MITSKQLFKQVLIQVDIKFMIYTSRLNEYDTKW